MVQFYPSIIAINANRGINLDFTVDDNWNAGNAGIYITAAQLGNKGLEGMASYAYARLDSDSNRSYRGSTNQVIFDPTHTSGTLTMSNIIPLIGSHCSVRMEGTNSKQADITMPVAALNTLINAYDGCNNTVTFSETTNFNSQGIRGEAYQADLRTANHKHISIQNSNPVAGWTQTNLYGIHIAEQTGGTAINNEIFLEGGGEIFFRDQEIHVGSLDDGHLDLTADTSVDINSVLTLTPTSRPGSPVEGMMYADSTDHHLYFYNGSSWVQCDN